MAHHQHARTGGAPPPGAPPADGQGLSAGRGRTNPKLALAAMMFGVAMIFIDQTIVAIAAPSISDEVGLTSSGVQWVINAYLLALAAFFALGGRLSDIYGHKRIMLVGTVVFVLASVMCGAVPDSGFAQAWLITFRAIQGFGAALLFPAALAVVVAVFPVERRGRALALFFGLTGALTALGPLLGGWLTEWTWRAIFWVNVPVAVIALVLASLAHIPDRRRAERLDLPGAFLVAVGMGLGVLGFQQASSWGWRSVATWACIIGGAAVLVVFCRYELRVREPLIQLRVFRDRAFTADNLVLFFAMLAFVPLFFFASVYAQVSLGATANQAALYLLYFFAGFAIASQVGGRILDKRGARPAIRLGGAVGAVGFALWAARLTDLSMHNQWPFVALAGAGIGFLLAPASTDAVNRSIGASYGEVTGVIQTIRNYAAAIGLAVYGTLLTHATTDNVAGTLRERGLSTGEADRAASGVAEAVTGQTGSRGPGGDGPLAETLRNAAGAIRLDFAEANRWVFYGMAIAMALAFVCSWFHPGTRVTEHPPQDEPAGPAGHDAGPGPGSGAVPDTPEGLPNLPAGAVERTPVAHR
ncbi:MFS transporter [Streptomyces lonarensis]|uniref:MFS transporter n=2 Tax=Streptomyces lonarensis TaxID=700599 RepID=A0A7X6D2P6_9ACTN|nr:MFS transporter [Streptomyces lonarensis]